jgi:hypothetical protein
MRRKAGERGGIALIVMGFDAADPNEIAGPVQDLDRRARPRQRVAVGRRIGKRKGVLDCSSTPNRLEQVSVG